MMKQLKKCLYGKSLKQLFITFLISFSILLVGSSVSAFSVAKIGTNVESPISNNNVSFSVLPYGSYISNYLGQGRPFLAFANRSLNTQGTKGQYIYFLWIDGKPYYYYSYAGNSSTSMTNYQGFIDTYKLCDELTENSTSTSNCSDNIYNSQTVNDFLDTVKISDYFGYNRSSSRASICFSSSEYGKSLCFWDLSSSKLTGSVNFPSLMDFETVYGYDSSSPSAPINSNTGGNLNPDSDLVYYSDNNQIYYDTFKSIGFDEELCYSNFELTDTVNITTAYYDLFPTPSSGSGANIFELYENWGFYPRNPFNSYYSWYSSRYNKLNNSSDKGTNFIMSLYSGVSIGNYYIFDKLFNNEFVFSYSLSYKDYYCFCDMAINGFNPDDMNHCDLSSSFDNIMMNPGVRNGTSIGVDGDFILSGANDYGYFSGSDGIFDVFNRLFSQFKGAFRVDNSLAGTSGILPSYIILGFFLFVLLYVLKR